MKRLFSLGLALLACLSLAAPALAAEGDFTVSESGVLTQYSGPGGEVVIPDGVKWVGDCVFAYREDVTAVTFPDSLSGIGQAAFSDCTGLTELTLSGGVVINDSAFSDCTGLTELTLPAGTIVSTGAFGSCTGLKRVEVLPTVWTGTYSAAMTTINDYAFPGCSGLTEVVLPGGAAEADIRQYAFQGTPWQEEQDRQARQPLIVGAVVGVALVLTAVLLIVRKKKAKA